MKIMSDVKRELKGMQTHLRSLENDQYNFEYNVDDAEESLLADKLNHCIELSNDLCRSIKYLDAEIIAEGTLYLNDIERYEIDNYEYELSSGESLEYWEDNGWLGDRIEHFNGEYGLYYARKHNLEGLYVRVRKLF